MKTIKISDKAYKMLDERRGNHSFNWVMDQILFGDIADLTLGREEIEEIVENKIYEMRR